MSSSWKIVCTMCPEDESLDVLIQTADVAGDKICIFGTKAISLSRVASNNMFQVSLAAHTRLAGEI